MTKKQNMKTTIILRRTTAPVGRTRDAHTKPTWYIYVALLLLTIYLVLVLVTIYGGVQ